ncbi:MAG TPA: hypothetical protein VFE32_17480 [Puia sp.]|jgi:chaperonin cofactor prefoldin|nr:hypothetical protein [Puia sp.]
MASENPHLVAATQADIRDIKKDVAAFGQKLDNIHYALVGNELARDGGLIQRVIDLEKQKENLEERVDRIEKTAIKSNTQVKLMWSMAGGTIALIFTYIVEHIFKH